MTNELEALARRAIVCPKWKWLPGMRVIREDGKGFNLACEVAASKVSVAWIPDLTDPATVGCLLALVREAYRECKVWVMPRNVGFIVTVQARGGMGSGLLQTNFGTTEADALVAALEAAK